VLWRAVTPLRLRLFVRICAFRCRDVELPSDYPIFLIRSLRHWHPLPPVPTFGPTGEMGGLELDGRYAEDLSIGRISGGTGRFLLAEIS